MQHMNSQATSFIPQRPTAGKVKSRGVRKIYVLAYVTYVIFFGTALAAGGVFFLKVTLGKELEAQQATLAQEKSKFSESDMMSVREMQSRLNTAKDRLDKHISVVSIFDALERSALQSVQFVTFNYVRTTDGAPLVSFIGNTDKFDNLIFQREVLQSNPILASSTFSDIALNSSPVLDKSGQAIQGTQQQVITFGIEASIPTSLVQYQPSATAPNNGQAQADTFPTSLESGSGAGQGTSSSNASGTGAPQQQASSSLINQ